MRQHRELCLTCNGRGQLWDKNAGTTAGPRPMRCCYRCGGMGLFIVPGAARDDRGRFAKIDETFRHAETQL